MSAPAPKLTVVIPTHGRPAGLAAALDSLASAQAPLGGISVVVVADGDQSHVEQTIERAVRGGLDVRLIVQPRSGPAAARNIGAREAASGVLAFIDDDCRATPEWPAALVAAVARCPEGIVGGSVVNGRPSRLGSEISLLVLVTVTRWFTDHDPAQAFAASMNLAMGTATFAALGGFDESFPIPGGEDRDLCERAIEAQRPLLHDPAAIVVHDLDLDLGGLWRQQRAYGRGAVHLRAARTARGRASPSLRPGFYAELARAAWREPRRVRMLVGVGMSQIAYLSGVLTEDRSSRVRQEQLAAPRPRS